MKMKALKKIFVVSMVFCMALVTITACSNGGGESTSSQPKTNQSESNEQNNSSASEPSENQSEPTPISISMRTLGFTHVENHSNINEDEYVKKLEELTNVDLDIQLIPNSKFATTMDLRFAAGDIPDVVQTSGGYGAASGETLKEAVEAGVFLPLDDLIDKYGPNLKAKIPEEAWEQQRFEDGKIYGIPEFLSNPSRRATIVRADVLEKLGIEIPKTPEEAWTVEETIDILRRMKHEGGLEWPYTGRAEFKYSDTFFGAYDVQPFKSMWEMVDGKLQPKFFDSENMMKALEVYKTLYDEGLIHPEFLTHEFNNYKNAAITGKAGMWSMNANELLQWEQQLQQNVPDADLEIVPAPRGPDGSGGYYLYGNVTRAFLINKDAEDKAAEIIKFLDWQLSDEAEIFFTFGIEGKDYEVNNGVIEYKEPQTDEEVNIERFRTAFLWMIHDTTYFSKLLERTEEGRNLMNVYDHILAYEGRDGYRFDPELDAHDNKPQLKMQSDRPAPLLLEHMARMITGEESIDQWDNVVQEWLDRGGAEVVEQAQERYENGEYMEPRR